MPIGTDLEEGVMSVVLEEVARRTKIIKLQEKRRYMKKYIKDQEEARREVDRRCAEYEKSLYNKMRAKHRRSKKRSIGNRKRAKIQAQQMEPEAGSEKASAGLEEEAAAVAITKAQDKQMIVSKDEGMSQQQQQTEEKKKKTKLMRLKPEANYLAAVFCNATPFPRIPDWQLAMQSEYTQELYRESLALSEEMDKVHQDMNEQVFRKGYIEVEVTDDEDDKTE